MRCFDFFLKAQYCEATRHGFVPGAGFCAPTTDTLKWFTDQGIRLWVGHRDLLGCLCTAVDVTDEQAVLIQLAFDVPANAQELYEKQEIRLTI